MAAGTNRKSQISRHPDRLSIELARVKGVSLDRIAEKYGVHRDAVARHMAALDPDYRAALAADVPIAELAERAAKEGGTILDNLSVLRAGLMQSAYVAKAGNDHHAYAALSRVALEVIRETGKFTGEMVNAPSIQNVVNNTLVLMNAPPIMRLRSMLERRLAPFPEAYDAVMAGLAELEATPEPSRMIDARAA